MDKISNEIRIQQFRKSTKCQVFLVSDLSSAEILQKIIQEHNLDTEKIYKKFAITVGDIILGFYRIEDTVPLLQQELGLDPHTAALLGADVLEFLTPLSDPNWQPPVEETDIDSLSITENTPTSANDERWDNDTVSSPIKPEIPIPPIQTPPYSPPVAPSLHTMAGDMANKNQQRPTHRGGLVGGLNYEPVYTSSQDNIRRSLSDTPSYTQKPPASATKPKLDEPPRWGSEQ